MCLYKCAHNYTVKLQELEHFIHNQVLPQHEHSANAKHINSFLEASLYHDCL